MEGGEAAVEFVVLVIADRGGTTTHTLTLCARAAQGYRRDTIVDEFVEQLLARPVLVAESEEEAISHRFAVGIEVVNDMEAIAHHNLFDGVGTACVLARVLDKAYLPLACGTEHSRHGELHRMGYARGEAIENDVYEVAEELSVVAISLCQSGEATVRECGVHSHDSPTLTCIGEHLGARNHVHAVVGIASDRGLIRRFVGYASLLAEVHIEVG